MRWEFAAAMLMACLVAGTAAAASPSKTKGFAFTYFWYPIYEGADACPQGPGLGVREWALPKMTTKKSDTTPDEFMAKVTAMALRGRETVTEGLLPKQESKQAINGLNYAPGLQDQCAHPAEFEDPPARVVEGKVAFGMDLDGAEGAKTAPNTCAHESFTNPAGQTGIDNQLYRIIGCTNAYRHGFPYSPNITNEYQDNRRKGGSVTTMLEITGIDDERNDPDVMVGIYSSEDPTRFDSQAKGVWHRSLTIHADKKYGAVGHGKIVDGVLYSDPVDVRLYDPEYGGKPAEYYIRGARVRLELAADGTAKGMLGGYEDVETTYDHEFRFFGGTLRSAVWGYSCPSMYAALKQYADGYPDPVTGKCTALSTAWTVEAVPAFIIHPKEEPKTAEAQIGAKGPTQLSDAKAAN